jgi:hypothetical protein
MHPKKNTGDEQSMKQLTKKQIVTALKKRFEMTTEIVTDMAESKDRYGLDHVLPRRHEIILIVRAIEDGDLDDLAFFDKRKHHEG